MQKKSLEDWLMNMLPQKDKTTSNGAKKRKKKEKMAMIELVDLVAAFDYQFSKFNLSLHNIKNCAKSTQNLSKFLI
jgi:hypothetical protein